MVCTGLFTGVPRQHHRGHHGTFSYVSGVQTDGTTCGIDLRDPIAWMDLTPDETYGPDRQADPDGG